MMVRVLLAILALCCICAATASSDVDSFKLYLLRHAEKQLDGSRDPELNAAGKRRAAQLASWLGDRQLQKVWSSDYRRTRDTATPLLNESGLELAIYDPRQQGALAGTLLAEKQNAVIVGHSNTIPELARLLCHCEVDDMDESEYDRLIVVAVDNGKIVLKTLQQGQLFQP